uniref:Uncharacterized protein n=1 Tax=Oryza punctata TaxID=4537 RepID=A0A0E0KI82_ORYPU
MQTIRWLPLHASLCSFVLMSLLVQSSHAARPSPGELQGWQAAAAAVGSSAEKQLVDPRIITAGAGRVADVVAAPPAPVMTTTTAGSVGDDRRRSGGDDVLLLPRRGRSVALVMARAARRALAEAAAASSATDGSGPSCHSNNVHITCSPPLQN